MKDGPVYIVVMNFSGEYAPVMMGVLRRRDGYEIGFKMINGAVSDVFTYHYKGEQKFETEEDAQSALNAMATARHWKPYQRLRRW